MTLKIKMKRFGRFRQVSLVKSFTADQTIDENQLEILQIYLFDKNSCEKEHFALLIVQILVLNRTDMIICIYVA